MKKTKIFEKCDTIEEREDIQSGDRPSLIGGISASSGNGTNSATGCIERGSVINLIGRKITCYCQGNNGSDIRFDLQESGRVFVRRPKWLLRSGNKFLRFTENASGVIPVYSARPDEYLLGVSEIIEGIPLVPDASKYYLVNNEVAYALIRRIVSMRNILIPGRARKDSLTCEIMGFDSLTLIHFPGDE